MAHLRDSHEENLLKTSSCSAPRFARGLNDTRFCKYCTGHSPCKRWPYDPVRGSGNITSLRKSSLLSLRQPSSLSQLKTGRKPFLDATELKAANFSGKRAKNVFQLIADINRHHLFHHQNQMVVASK
ncbi:unnamed protein product [Pocillopora meandrina]|uniref:Uncharacterized protein n=1 Tax=Pocillopora meandrina TaxID=46732 RepID=A0AAU9XAJ0_9CNID|nr:unnamed protein product [Pocillopora meandrina]